MGEGSSICNGFMTLARAPKVENPDHLTTVSKTWVQILKKGLLSPGIIASETLSSALANCHFAKMEGSVARYARHERQHCTHEEDIDLAE